MTPIEVKKIQINLKVCSIKITTGKYFFCLLSGQTFRVIVKIFVPELIRGKYGESGGDVDQNADGAICIRVLKKPLSHLQLASANSVTALTSRDGIL